ncbi:hypothetical protein [Natrinema altunense]|uniref:SWIM-type domain-containing protein n=1 Tax=Natrinema altunense TaxID=222984 RepID=A0A482Y1B8_9EURY|nr:hypothetical protein [Natrinema altunense]RZH69252.1 hypothetical protein ELS17_07395 [Natrinema altunense]
MEEIIEKYEDEEYEHQEVKPVQTGLYYVWSNDREETHVVSPIEDKETYYTVSKEVICDCEEFNGSCIHTKAVQEAIERQKDIDGDDPATRANLREAQYSLWQIRRISEKKRDARCE